MKKKVEASFVPFKLDKGMFKVALGHAALSGMNRPSEVRGFRQAEGQVERYRGSNSPLNFCKKINWTLSLIDDRVETVVKRQLQGSRRTVKMRRWQRKSSSALIGETVIPHPHRRPRQQRI